MEASYQRDKKIRDIAEDFYKSLVKFLKTRSDELVPWKHGGVVVMAGKFWKHPKAHKLGVIFTPKVRGLSGGVGRVGGLKVMIFPIMIGPGDKRHLDTRLIKDAVIHEMIHFLDPGYGKGGGIKRYEKTRKSPATVDRKAYMNDPGEWNALWQEGAAKFERMIRSGGLARNPKVREHFFGDGSLAQMRVRADQFWEKEFFKYMSSKTKRKFDKRFAQLWTAMKKEGLL